MQIKEKNINNVTIIDCYDFEDTKDKIEDLMKKYKLNLNTDGINNIK